VGQIFLSDRTDKNVFVHFRSAGKVKNELTFKGEWVKLIEILKFLSNRISRP
jgi:hypothetical protein